ncbi:hypothetical protein EDB89DRAFT_2074260 [Lactarius sanguifluus]|nr:hypothetical protein EDB89DRAFT_2074260 [Lactarius sanguifluus]
MTSSWVTSSAEDGEFNLNTDSKMFFGQTILIWQLGPLKFLTRDSVAHQPIPPTFVLVSRLFSRLACEAVEGAVLASPTFSPSHHLSMASGGLPSPSDDPPLPASPCTLPFPLPALPSPMLPSPSFLPSPHVGAVLPVATSFPALFAFFYFATHPTLPYPPAEPLLAVTYEPVQTFVRYLLTALDVIFLVNIPVLTTFPHLLNRVWSCGGAALAMPLPKLP